MGKPSLNLLMQVCLVTFTMAGFLLTSLKLPQYGVAVSLFAQIFWVYSSYKAWRKADQLGIFINTLATTCIFIFGVINYWLLK
jgi:hypothetical protein